MADSVEDGEGQGSLGSLEKLFALGSSLHDRHARRQGSISSVRLTLCDFCVLVQRVSNEGTTWTSFVRKLSSLPCLEELVVEDLEHRGLSVRADARPSLVSLLSNLAPCMPRLKTIRMHGEHYIESSDVEDVATLLGKAALLEEATFSRLSLRNVWPEDSVNLGPILLKLSSLPKLRKVYLGRIRPGTYSPMVCKESVLSLTSSPSLEDLFLHGLNLSEGELEVLAKGLTVATSIKRVSVLNVQWCEKERLLKSDISSTSGVEFVKAMTNNFLIESLDLSPSHISTTLWREQIASFCILNKMKRFEALRSHETCHMDWIRLMTAVRDDVNALLYLLRRNPSLCV